LNKYLGIENIEMDYSTVAKITSDNNDDDNDVDE
jgi:hypothetical protein